MALNYETKETNWVIDPYRLVLIKGNKKSYENCVGETFLMWLCNEQPKKLGFGLDSCLRMENDRFFLMRHPEYPTQKNSRDHWTYFILFKYLRKTSDGGRFKISFNFFIRMTISLRNIFFFRGMNFWMHTLRGKRWAENLFYATQIPGAYVALYWYRFWYYVGNLGPEWSRERWAKEGTFRQVTMNRWQTFVRDRIIMNTVPPFSLHVKAWQLYPMRNCLRLQHLKRVLLRRAGRNPINRLLLDDTTVTIAEINNYESMSGWPPGANMDLTSDRYHYKLPDKETKYNNLETDLLAWLWVEKRRQWS